MWLLLAFIGVPLIEIALFIQIGGWIGLWPTLLVVVLTAVLGSALVRSQGIQTIRQLQSRFDKLEDPTEPLAHGAMILFSGAMLLTPGFFTDTVGFLLLVPQIRAYVFREMRKRVRVQSFQMGANSNTRARPAASRHADDVIDGEFQEIDPDSIPPQPTHRPSGWTRH